MKVTVSVHGRYHAFELARGLARAGHLEQVLTTYPGFVARRFIGAGSRIETAPLLELRRRLYGHFGLGGKPDLAIAKGFARFASRHVTPTSQIFVGWSSASLEAIAPAQRAGARVILERGSTHISAQTEVLRDAYTSFGLGFNETDAEMIDRELQEYEQADRIAVPSQFAAQTFVERGIAGDKLMVNGLGVDLARFQAPESRPADRLPRIVFAGGVSIRKGIPWLLEAFAPLAAKAELHILGPVAAPFQPLLAKMPQRNVLFRGAIAGARLAGEYGRADIFCLPSIEEGYGMVIAEAMACGLPVVTTACVGAADLITTGRDGLVVPPADARSLRTALEQLVDDRDLRLEMGRRALATIGAGHSWQDYSRRTILSYEALLAGP